MIIPQPDSPLCHMPDLSTGRRRQLALLLLVSLMGEEEVVGVPRGGNAVHAQLHWTRVHWSFVLRPRVQERKTIKLDQKKKKILICLCLEDLPDPLTDNYVTSRNQII